MNSEARPVTRLKVEKFRIFEQAEFLLEAQQVIVGANGAGKTSVLWALLLLFHSYNSRATEFKRLQFELGTECRAFRGRRTQKPASFVLLAPDVAELLNAPALEQCNIPELLLGFNSTQATIEGSILGVECTCTIKKNGGLEFTPADLVVTQKIRFAVLGASPSFSARDEVESDVLASAKHNCRRLYKALSESHKRDVASHMTSLFPSYGTIQVLLDGRRLVVKARDSMVEIIYEGQAFQKIFQALVYLYALVATEPPQEVSVSPPKVMLMEEPETHLYSTLQEEFLLLVRGLAKRFGVQLIVTTNSPNVQSVFNLEREVLVLTKPKESQSEQNRSALLRASKLEVLGLVSKRKVILVEGQQDVRFIERVAKALDMNASLQEVTLHPLGGQAGKAVVRALNELETPTLVVCDRDFRQDARASTKADIIEWDLPCIESYLFIWYYENNAAQLKELFAINDMYLLDAFLRGFRAQNKVEKEETTAKTRDAKMFQLWSTAKDLVMSNETISKQDLVTIAQVIHGRTWVSLIKKSTPWLIDNFASPKACSWSEVALRSTLERILVPRADRRD